MQAKYFIALVLFNAIFLILGGIAFHFIEYPNEKDSIDKSKDFYGDYLDRILEQNATCLSREELDRLIRDAITEYDDGNIFVDDSPNWDISGSIFFATTVITTIGYGHISPSTTGGQVFCIFFALLGIPLCLIMLGEFGIKLSIVGQRMDRRLNRGYFPKAGKYFRPVIISVIGFALFVLIPAAIIAFYEEWGYGTAIYYGIITLTTIGFGDLVAGQNNDLDYRWVYNIAISGWILVGLAWVANLIANCQEIYKDIGEEIDDLVDSDSDDEKEENSRKEHESSNHNHSNGHRDVEYGSENVTKDQFTHKYQQNDRPLSTKL